MKTPRQIHKVKKIYHSIRISIRGEIKEQNKERKFVLGVT